MILNGDKVRIYHPANLETFRGQIVNKDRSRPRHLRKHGVHDSYRACTYHQNTLAWTNRAPFKSIAYAGERLVDRSLFKRYPLIQNTDIPA